MSLRILGTEPTVIYEKKVILIMYYSELLAINRTEIKIFLNKTGRGKILKVFYLDTSFTEYVYQMFCKSEIEAIFDNIYERLIRMQELFYHSRTFRLEQDSHLKQ